MAVAARLTDIYGQPIDIDRPMPADQFLELTDRLPHRSELVDGEVVMVSPSIRHQDIVAELLVRLRGWTKAAPGRGQCGMDVSVRLDDRNVYRPGVWWYREERKPGVGDFRPPTVADLVVEVLSPSNRSYDLGAKRATYERRGLPELWIIDPTDVTATVWRRSLADHPAFDVTVKVERDDSLDSPQLPGFVVRLADLFT